MIVTSKQAHVLDNVDRVVPLAVRSTLPRYQLDGEDCTGQIERLVARKLISKHSNGGFRRLRSLDVAIRNERMAPRQPAPASAIEAIRAALSAPDIRSGAGRR